MFVGADKSDKRPTITTNMLDGAVCRRRQNNVNSSCLCLLSFSGATVFTSSVFAAGLLLLLSFLSLGLLVGLWTSPSPPLLRTMIHMLCDDRSLGGRRRQRGLAWLLLPLECLAENLQRSFKPYCASMSLQYVYTSSLIW